MTSSHLMTTPAGDENYEVARQGIPQGTFPLSALAGLIDSGQLRWSDDCWTEGMETWRKLDEIKDQIESAAPESAGESYLLPVGAALGLAIAVGLGYVILGAGDEGGDPATPAVSAPRTLSAREKDALIGLSELQDRITSLSAASFVTKRDMTTGTLTYAHRFYDNVGNRIPLRVQVEADGRCHLYTYYRGHEWLLHRQLRLTIGQQILTTERLPAHRCTREIGDDNFVMEACHFQGDADRKMVARLAAAHGSPIRLQLAGYRPHELELSFETKMAIKDCQELAELLARRQRIQGTLTSNP